MPDTRPRRAPAAAVLAAGAVFLAGCAGPSSQSKRALNALIAAQDYDGAEAFLEKSKESEYGKKNQVLYYLDRGTVLHDAGKYKESDQSFDRAETRMHELYTVSISKTGGMFLLNDNTVDYAGEPFERALTNVYRALNYVFLGEPDEALVESRKVELFLDELNSKLAKKNAYKDDAFARYLDALLYADEGKMDDARISMKAATDAYGRYASDYQTPAPRFDLRRNDSKDSGEVVFIHYNGVAPRKVSKTFQVLWNDAVALTRKSEDTEAKDARFKNALAAGFTGNSVTVSYPAYVQDPYKITASELQADPGAADEASASTLLMEDISAIAFKDLSDRQALIKARSIARATIRYVIAESVARAACAAVEKQYGADSFQMKLCKLGGGVLKGATAAVEVADTRGWAALPSQIRMARLKLPPGKHQILANFKDAAGTVVFSHLFKDVVVEPSKRVYLHYRTAL